MNPLKFGAIEFPTPLLLAPMAGYTNLPFRCCVRALGGLSLAVTDLVNARSLIELNPKSIQMITTCQEDRPLCVQLFGSKKEEVRDASRLMEEMGVDLIDINMGCPAPKVNRTGAGAALMKDEEMTEDLLEAVVSAVKIPVTVKMRLGWDQAHINAHLIAPRLEQIGVAAITIHGRTRSQEFKGEVNLEGIREVVQSVKKIPVIGNGDICSEEDAKKMMNVTGCAGVMVGRAALRDPFFFRRTNHYLQTGECLNEPTLRDRILFMHYHFGASVYHYGEKEACILFRKVISGYSEFFPERKKWVMAMHALNSVDQYIDICRERCSNELPEECKNPQKIITSYKENTGYKKAMECLQKQLNIT